MARKRKGGNAMSVAVDGLDEMRKIPGFIDRGQRILLDRSTQRIRDEIAKRAPGGASGKAGRDVEARTLTSTVAIIRSKGFEGAKALERGAFIRSKRGPDTAIRFEGEDGPVFVRAPRGIRIKGRGYFKKGLRTRSKHIRQAYHEGFGDLEAQP